MSEIKAVRASDLERSKGMRWLVPGLIAEGGIACIVGASKSMKTWFALELLTSIASGLQCARNWVPTSKRRVLYIAGESTCAALQRRIEGLSHAKVAMVEELDLHLIAEQSIALDTDAGLAALESEIVRLRPAVVCLDPLSRFLPNTPESSARRMGVVLEAFALLARKHAFTMILVHHLSKQATRSPDQGGLGMRGSSQLDSYWSSLAVLRREGDGVYLTLRFREAEGEDRIPITFVETAGGQFLLHAGPAATGTGWVESDAKPLGSTATN